MKTIVNILFIATMILHCGAQKKEVPKIDVLLISKDNNLIEFDQIINLSKSMNLLIAPQAGGLFNKSHHENRNIICLKNYYHDLDLGVKIGVSYEWINNITFGTFYNIEVVKISFSDARKIKGALMKLSIDFKF